MKKNIFKTGMIISLVLLSIVCVLIAYQYILRKNAEEALGKLQAGNQAAQDAAGQHTGNSIDSTPSDKSGTSQAGIPEATGQVVDPLAERGITIPEKAIDWASLKSQNADIYAWIYLPGTNIDYPIVQHPEERSYYLNHNLDGSEGYPGCIYTQNVNTKDWTEPNTVIYGHNMKDGSMFHDLHKFEDAAFFDQNQFLFIYTPERNYAYEIFACYPFSNADLIMCFDYSTPEARLVYFDSIWTNRSMTSHFRDSVVLYGDSRIVTLSTCISGQPDMRYLVQAVLIG